MCGDIGPSAQDPEKTAASDDVIVTPARNEHPPENVPEVGTLIERVPFAIHLRYEEDVVQTYRDYYRDQVVRDNRSTLGRFLFGVSSTTVAFLVGVLKFTEPDGLEFANRATWFLLSAAFLLISFAWSLRLAIPTNQRVDPTTIELVKLHQNNSNQLTYMSLSWLVCWLAGLTLGIIGFFM